MKTRREHLSVLPKEVQEQVMLNIQKDLDKENAPFDKNDRITLKEMLDTEIGLTHIGFTLTGAFSFTASEEGSDYWWGVYKKYFK